MTDLSKAIHEALTREYYLYSCGYIKNRRRIYLQEREKNIGKVAAAFKKIKYRYKSAFWETWWPPKKLMLHMFNAPNPIFARLKKNDEFCGELITTPIPYD